MQKFKFSALVVALLCLFQAGPIFAKNPIAIMTTNHGTIEIELFQDKAPISVKNFIKYVDAKFYDKTIFHRVIENFMIQGGGFTKDGKEKSTNPPIKNEATNGLKNNLGTVAMARTNIVDSATAQFFINVRNNTFLNHRGKDPLTYGYAVFGNIVSGQDVVDKIKKVKVAVAKLSQNTPIEPVVIESIRMKK
ncbi:MAG: peptidylprolyl isomerase [Bacteriovoracaceae bacterium]|nr:peptidylprolyl isomerase [Bacteriovoracaceae bacterium]